MTADTFCTKTAEIHLRHQFQCFGSYRLYLNHLYMSHFFSRVKRNNFFIIYWENLCLKCLVCLSIKTQDTFFTINSYFHWSCLLYNHSTLKCSKWTLKATMRVSKHFSDRSSENSVDSLMCCNKLMVEL